jgi:hypothetical protein
VDDTAIAAGVDADETHKGIIEVGTQAEVAAVTLDNKAVTPLKLGATACMLAGDQTVADRKAFTGTVAYTIIPELPSSDPTLANQAVRKSYSDKNILIAKVGSDSHDSSVTGTQNIAHGLGKIPKLVRIKSWTAMAMLQEGVYDGTTQRIYNLSHDNVSDVLVFSVTVNKVVQQTIAGESAYATITVDATNIILTWGKEGSPTWTIPLYWEAIG